MWYILNMNKDVIYIEPEDDITDIITKIEKTKEKIVALVPPKKAGVFRSVVNIKLIAKVGATSEKTIVLVTTDPSIIKLAAATKIPVTKDLQSAPSVPKIEDEEDGSDDKEELIEESDGTVETKEDVDELEGGDEKLEEEKAEEEDAGEDKETAEKPTKKEKSDKKARKSSSGGNKITNWLREHKKIAIFGGIGVVLVVVFLVWALVIAPAATVTVGIRTEAKNFSENVTFTTKLNEENAKEGKFYLDEKKVEVASEVTFEATGQKNVGQKASGDVVIYAYFRDKGTIPVNAGSSFTISGLSFVSDKEVSLSWDGETVSDCENNGQASSVTSGCLISGRVPVTAAAPGANYNIAASNSGWNTVANVAVYSDKAMSGGTDETITVVQQSDIDKAKAELAASVEADNKTKLYEELGEGALVIDASFSQSTSDAVASPAVGGEVKGDTKPTLKAVTTAAVFVIDKTKVEEFIMEKADIGENKKIYEMKDPFIENFLKADNGYSGKLKTSYKVGPKVTENDVIEMIKGKGLGEAQHDLRDIEGITSVTIDTSFPWVTSIPGNTNKITVILDVKE